MSQCVKCHTHTHYDVTITSRTGKTYHAACFIDELITLLDTIDGLCTDIIQTTQTTNATANSTARRIKRLIKNGS